MPFLTHAQQKILATQITTKDGLSQNSVNQILEDSDGYLWFATQDGLNRYNGYEFKIYRPSETNSFSISDNFVIQVLEDKKNRLWLNTRNGLNLFDKKSEKFYHITMPTDIAPQPYQLRLYGDTIYFHSTNNVYSQIWKLPADIELTDPRNDIESIGIKLDHPKVRITNYHLNKQGELTLFWSDTIFHVPNKKTYKSLGQDLSFSVQNWDHVELDKGQIILPDFNHLSVFDESTFTLNSTLAGLEAYHFFRKGNDLWAATKTGLFRISDDLSSKHRITINDNESTSNLIIHHMMKDRFGQIWLGTANKGAFVYNPQKEQFNYIDPDPGVENIVWDISESNGNLLAATDLGIIDFNSNIHHFKNTRITSCLIDSKNRKWAGSATGEIYLNESGSWQELDKPSTLAIIDFVEAFGKIYIATHSGLYVYDNERLEYIPVVGTMGTYLMGLHLDSKKTLWIAHNFGVAFIREGQEMKDIPYDKGKPKNSINFNFSSGFAEDINGDMWIATYGGGISHLKSDSTFEHFTELDGLSNNVVHGIIADQSGTFWLTSNGGLSTFNPITKEFINFTMDNGLLSHNFSINSFQSLSSGEIAVGTVEGILKFDPSLVSPFDLQPAIKWEQIQINYKRARYSDDINWLKEIELNNQDRVFSLSFSALKFDLSDDVKYSYILEGFDEDWVEIQDNSRRLSYSSLPYSVYTLKVRASSKNNHFDPVTRSLKIIVNPPFYLTWWFIGICIILFLSIAFGIVYYLSRRKLKAKLRELETKEKVQAERERISRDLHDSVGTHFAYIVSRLDFLYLGWDKPAIGDKKDYLGNVTDFARSGMRMLRETIWALNEEKVEATSLKAKIDDYLKLCLSNEKLTYGFNFNSISQKVNAVTALNSFRVIQEGVSNSLKHANARHIQVDLLINENEIDLSISDDGQGFDVQEGKAKQDHYGMDNLEKRAKEMEALLEIQSGESGTTINISSKNTP